MRAHSLFALFVFAGLVSCGGGSGESNMAERPAIQNPVQSGDNVSFSVDFPIPGSLAVADTLAFSGRISGLSNNSDAEVRITVAGQTYAGQPDASGWVLEDIPVNTSEVVSYDIDLVVNNLVSASESVQLSFDDAFVPFGIGDAITIDDAGSIVYLVDDSHLIAVDLETGTRSDLTDVLALRDEQVTDLLWMPDTETLLALHDDDELTGYRRTAGDWQAADLPDLNVTAAALGMDQQTLFLYRQIDNTLLQLDGDLNIFAEYSLGGHLQSASLLAAISSLELALLTDNSLVIFNVSDQSSQSFSLEDLNLGSIDDIAVDAESEQIYLRSASLNELWRLELEPFVAERISVTPTAYAIDFSAEQRALIFSSPNQLSSVNTQTLDISTISQLTWGSGSGWLAPTGLTISEDSEAVYVSDLATDDIFHVDLLTGHRTRLNANGAPMDAVTGIAQNGGNVYSVDWAQKSVLVTEVESGLTTDLMLGGSGGLDLAEPIAIDLDPDHFRAFILDRGLAMIHEVDTSSGVASVLVDSQDASALTLANSLTFDETQQRIYWSTWVDNSLHSLDLNTLQTELVSGLLAGVGPNFKRPGAVAQAEEERQLFVADILDSRVFSVDLDSGERKVLLAAGQISGADALAYNSSRKLVMILDAEVGVLYALNPLTGDLVIVSM